MQTVRHPAREEISLSKVLKALSDPSRREILRLLATGPRDCTDFDLPIAKSTLSNHLKILRESGLTHTDIHGKFRTASLRSDDIDARFPGLLQATGVLTK